MKNRHIALYIQAAINQRLPEEGQITVEYAAHQTGFSTQQIWDAIILLGQNSLISISTGMLHRRIG